MNPWDLPLSAYTPGLGDPAMEGGFQTATGAPMYTLEMYARGEAPYVTGATSQKNPTGALVYRSIGGRIVPVRMTDYGPGVKGLDIATENPVWAKNFPFQGSRDQSTLGRYGQMLADQDRDDLLRDIDNSIYGGGQAPPAPTPTPTPAPRRMADYGAARVKPNEIMFTDTAGNPLMSTPEQTKYAMANVPTSPSAGSTMAGLLGTILGQAGARMQSQGQAGMEQALRMLQSGTGSNPLAQLLQQLANNPTMYLQQGPIT